MCRETYTQRMKTDGEGVAPRVRETGKYREERWTWAEGDGGRKMDRVRERRRQRGS